MPTPKCWSCLSEDATVKVDGEYDLMCGRCWNSMSIFERVLLGLLLNDEDEGGLGIRAAFAVMSDRMMTEAFRAMTQSELEGKANGFRATSCKAHGNKDGGGFVLPAEEKELTHDELFLAHEMEIDEDGMIQCSDCMMSEREIIQRNQSTCIVKNPEDEPAGGIVATGCKAEGNTAGGGFTLPTEEKESDASDYQQTGA